MRRRNTAQRPRYRWRPQTSKGSASNRADPIQRIPRLIAECARHIVTPLILITAKTALRPSKKTSASPPDDSKNHQALFLHEPAASTNRDHSSLPVINHPPPQCNRQCICATTDCTQPHFYAWPVGSTVSLAQVKNSRGRKPIIRTDTLSKVVFMHRVPKLTYCKWKS